MAAGADPVVAKVFDLRDRVEANRKTDVMFPLRRPYVLLEYAFRLLAQRRRHLGLDAVKQLAPWLAKFVRARLIQGGPGIRLADCFWDFTSDQERAWLSKQPALAHLVPPPVEDVLAKAKWHIKMTAFVRLRARDPARARALLAKPPKGLKEKDRRNLIQFLREGLSDGDRDLLEREKSRLLVRLPGSSLWNELAALADNLLTVTGGKLRITPPDRFTELFERLGFHKDALDSSWADYTEQEFWCYQFLREVPLDDLARKWRLGPKAIVGLFLDEPKNKKKYQWALHDNLFEMRSAVWSQALLERRGPKVLDGDGCLSLARHLPPREREAALEPLIDNEPNYTINEFDDVLEYVWTPEFTRRQLARTKRQYFTPPRPRFEFDPSFGGLFEPLTHHGSTDAIADLPPAGSPDMQAARDELSAAWRERDEILTSFR